MFDGGADGRGGYVAKNGEHAIVGRDQPGVERLQIRCGEALDGGLGAERIESIACIAKELAAQGFERALEQLITLTLDSGQLVLAFAFEGGGGPGGMPKNVGEQVQAERKILRQHLGAHAKTLIACIRLEAATHAFDGASDFLGTPAGGPFDQ